MMRKLQSSIFKLKMFDTVEEPLKRYNNDIDKFLEAWKKSLCCWKKYFQVSSQV